MSVVECSACGENMGNGEGVVLLTAGLTPSGLEIYAAVHNIAACREVFSDDPADVLAHVVVNP